MKFNVEFMIKAKGITPEAEQELNRIFKNIESRSKEFSLIETNYTLNIPKKYRPKYKDAD